MILLDLDSPMDDPRTGNYFGIQPTWHHNDRPTKHWRWTRTVCSVIAHTRKFGEGFPSHAILGQIIGLAHDGRFYYQNVTSGLLEEAHHKFRRTAPERIGK